MTTLIGIVISNLKNKDITMTQIKNEKIEINFTSEEMYKIKTLLGDSFQEKIKSKILEMVFKEDSKFNKDCHNTRYLLIKNENGFIEYSSNNLEDIANHKFQEDALDYCICEEYEQELPTASDYQIYDKMNNVVLNAKTDYDDFFNN
jgi:hypothetical protein